jgi:hypothetical protein
LESVGHWWLDAGLLGILAASNSDVKNPFRIVRLRVCCTHNGTATHEQSTRCQTPKTKAQSVPAGVRMSTLRRVAWYARMSTLRRVAWYARMSTLRRVAWYARMSTLRRVAWYASLAGKTINGAAQRSNTLSLTRVRPLALYALSRSSICCLSSIASDGESSSTSSINSVAAVASLVAKSIVQSRATMALQPPNLGKM